MLNSNSKAPKILLQVTGSIAAFKAVALASQLIKKGYDLEVILSEGAEQFIGPASFEGLIGKKIHRGIFDPGAMMAHIELERAADLILLYPASAHTLAALANGLAHSLISTVFLAHEFKKPYLIAPAMNQAMWNHPATQKNLSTLKSWGISLIEPNEGVLACGEVGYGRLVEPEAMMEIIEDHLGQTNKTKSQTQLDLPRILVTAGGTTEPIDEVRHLTNFSTGRTGHQIALSLQEQGYPVTLLQSEYSSAYEGIQNPIRYSTTKDFAEKIKRELVNHDYDYVIHAAAVADYHVETITNGQGELVPGTSKIQGDSPLFLKLAPNPKIIRELRTWSRNKKMKIISFKLTTGPESSLKLESYDSEWIIHNDLKGVQDENHQGTLFNRDSSGHYQAQKTFRTKSEMKKIILDLIQSQGKQS